MKKLRFVAAALIVALLMGACALADVLTTGNVNLRTGPGLAYDTVTSVSAGEYLDYLGESSVDERGIAWYLVDYNGTNCWISSKFAELQGENTAPRALPDLSRIDGYMEVSGYFGKDLVKSAAEVGLGNYAEVTCEAPYQYSDGYLTFGAAYSDIEFMELKGGEYSVYGVSIGMSAEEAIAIMQQNGLKLDLNGSDFIVFEHPASADSYINIDGYDSCINLWLRNGVIVSLDWSSYTG